MINMIVVELMSLIIIVALGIVAYLKRNEILKFVTSSAYAKSMAKSMGMVSFNKLDNCRFVEGPVAADGSSITSMKCD